MNVSVDAAAIAVAIGRCVPSKVTPTISAAVDASMNWQNRRSDAALPEISGKGVSPPAVACGIVVISATMNRNIGTTMAAG